VTFGGILKKNQNTKKPGNPAKVTPYLHISIFCLNSNLVVFGRSENGPSADPPSGGLRRLAPQFEFQTYFFEGVFRHIGTGMGGFHIWSADSGVHP
jgi:hypothetical protein